MKILTCVIVCLFCTACDFTTRERSDAGAERAAALFDCDNGGDSPSRARPDSLVSRLITAINAGDHLDVARLAAFPGEDPDTGAARFSIEGFRQHLAGDVVGCEFLRAHDDWNVEYRLLSTSGASKSVLVYHDQFRDHTRLSNELLIYFPRAQRYAPAVVEALKTRDAQQLARLLSPDDIDYPPDSAARAIARYATLFDLGTLRIRYEGLQAGPAPAYGPDVNRPFRYVIEGEKDGRAVIHDIVIINGDGLLGWRDSLIPAYSGQ